MLKELRSANLARQREWETNGEFSTIYYSNALAGEVGEACNIVKKLTRERMGAKGSIASSSDLADELADILIYLDLLAAKEGIDLEAVTRAKFNRTSDEYGFTVKI